MGPQTATSLGTLWTAVTRAGGAVGFAPDAPEADIRAAAEQAIEDVRAGREQLFVLDADGELVGAVFLRRGPKATVRHRADVVRLMVHPDLQGRGWGKALLDAVVAHATAIGLEQLLLSARGGTTLPDFYAKQGWRQVGLFPDALRIGPDDLRDEHWFQLRL
ncbi:acetyltransferase (GNAT) family protein [Pseudonocardia hierapolitana]|uniref:Acetyltransferase (GNAT) family protein n=1 Tax=Pseudonocardia hierapolitana TaxID=1128676 RepID=A0A561SLV1_9PSEU|nr:GNAT family N-acetyltransferase [Pseudonocardia hierapolitana]TWF75847.1 acetyltransferase (GNAT) family protein [Pseudonocardia hierapolitana]